MSNIEDLLQTIIKKLDIIISNQTPVYKGLGYNFGVQNCVSKEEIPLTTPWTSPNTPSCKEDKLTNG